MGDFHCENSAKGSGVDADRQADRLSFATTEPFGKPDHSVHHPVLLFEKREDMFGGFWFDDSSFPFDPVTFDGSAHVATSDSNPCIVAYSLYLSSVRISSDEQFSVLFNEPDRCADRVSGLPVSFDADVFLVREQRQFVSCSAQ